MFLQQGSPEDLWMLPGVPAPSAAAGHKPGSRTGLGWGQDRGQAVSLSPCPALPPSSCSFPSPAIPSALSHFHLSPPFPAFLFTDPTEPQSDLKSISSVLMLFHPIPSRIIPPKLLNQQRQSLTGNEPAPSPSQKSLWNHLPDPCSDSRSSDFNFWASSSICK